MSASTRTSRPGRGAARRDRARDRVLRRRLGEVALRRAGRGLAVRPSRPRRPARAGVRRLAGPRAAVRVRDGDGSRRPASGDSSPAPRTWPRTTPRARATRSSPRSASTGSARTRCGRPRCSSSSSTRPASSSPRRASRRAARRLGRLSRPRLPGRARGARRARDHLRHAARRGHSLRAALLHDRRRAPLRGRPGRARSSPRARTSSGRTRRPGTRGQQRRATIRTTPLPTKTAHGDSGRVFGPSRVEAAEDRAPATCVSRPSRRGGSSVRPLPTPAIAAGARTPRSDARGSRTCRNDVAAR